MASGSVPSSDLALPMDRVVAFPRRKAPRVGLMRARINRLRTWVLMLLRAHLTPKSVALAVGIGVFVGILPLYGVHIFVCVVLARWLKLNQALMYAAANISNPLFAPFIVAGQIALGEWIRFGEFRGFRSLDLEGNALQVLQDSGDLVLSCLIGSLPMAIVSAALFGGLTWTIARRWERRRAAAKAPLGVAGEIRAAE